jgi:YHS domain-containing protein
MKTKLSFILIALTALSLNTVAQDANTRKKEFNLDHDVAISGYDPVAYFTENKAVKGKAELAVYHQGVLYYFSSPGHKEEFRKNPSRYEPQYGGWCAYAMGAKNEKVSINPQTFKIIDGKLYLFYNKNSNNTLTTWNKNEVSLKSKADANWKKKFH